MTLHRVALFPLLIAGSLACATKNFYEEYKRAHPDWDESMVMKEMSLQETLASIYAPGSDGNRIVVQKLLILRTDVDPWQEIDPEAVRRGEIAADGSYAVAATRYCRSKTDIEIVALQVREWALLPRNSLAAFDFHGLELRCMAYPLFLPARDELVATEHELLTRIEATFPSRPLTGIELYWHGLAYIEARRIDDAARMLKEGDEALFSGSITGTTFRSERSRLEWFPAGSDVSAMRSQLVRELERARGPAAQSPEP